MRKSIILFIGFIPCILMAQQQISNFGDLKFHTGTSITVFGNFSNNGNIQDTGNVVNFMGTTNQVISGSSVTSFRNCVVDNTNGITLLQSLNIANKLTLTTGGLFLQSNTLTIQNSGTGAIVRSAGYIVSEQANNSGKVSWIMNSTSGTHIFPFATTSGNYIPFTMDLTSGNIGTVTLATYPTNTLNLPYPANPDLVTHVNNSAGIDNSSNTVDRFWQIEKTGPTGTANITFTATASEVGIISGLQAYRWNTGSQGWETPPGVQTTGPTTVTVQSVNTFSPWTLAGNDSPLPIELLSFTATLNENDQVDLFWETATEINSDHFTVERSVDAIHFEEVLTKPAAGNSNVNINYSDLDPRPYSGISYYRLKEVDLNGDHFYSELATIYIDAPDEVEVMVYPNPGDNQNVFLRISGASGSEFLFNVIDMSGKMMCSKSIKAEGDSYSTRLSDLVNLSSGIYTVQLINGNEQFVQKLIIQ